MEIVAQLRKSRRPAEKSEQFETDVSEDELTYDQDTDVRFFYLKTHLPTKMNLPSQFQPDWSSCFED